MDLVLDLDLRLRVSQQKGAAENEIQEVAVPMLETEPGQQQGGEPEKQLDQQQQQGYTS